MFTKIWHGLVLQNFKFGGGWVSWLVSRDSWGTCLYGKFSWDYCEWILVENMLWNVDDFDMEVFLKWDFWQRVRFLSEKIDGKGGKNLSIIEQFFLFFFVWVVVCFERKGMVVVVVVLFWTIGVSDGSEGFSHQFLRGYFWYLTHELKPVTLLRYIYFFLFKIFNLFLFIIILDYVKLN